MFAQISGTSRKTKIHVRVSNNFKPIYNVYALKNGTFRPVWSYSWDTGSWGSCSASCGGGTQYRTVRCLRNDNIEMLDVFCNQAGNKPTTSQSCNTQPCYTYDWYQGSWGSCSASCGWGTQYRTVYCRRSDGANVNDSYCNGQGSKPSGSQSCYAGECITYDWYWGTWSSCPATCGTGYQTRTVYCRGSNGSSYPDSYCRGTKPSSSNECMRCTGCPTTILAANLRAYYDNKALQLTTNEVPKNDGKVTPWSWYETQTEINKYYKTGNDTDLIAANKHFREPGTSEKICPFAHKGCCAEKKWKWYVGCRPTCAKE